MRGLGKEGRSQELLSGGGSLGAGDPGFSRCAQPPGRCAMIRSGPPEPPSIFIGSAMMVVPVDGRSDMSATFSKAGMFLVISVTCASKVLDCP